jgi:hypothetical protein
MAVTLYGNFIDYNGDRTFIAAGNPSPVYNCGEFQCSVNYYLSDAGETVNYHTDQYRYDCNCDCNCL